MQCLFSISQGRQLLLVYPLQIAMLLLCCILFTNPGFTQNKSNVNAKLTNGNRNSTVPFPFFDDFENGLHSWGGDWHLTSITFRSPSHSVTDSPEGNSRPFSVATLMLVSPIDLSSSDSPVLTFWQRYNVQANADFCSVELSDDGGLTWTLLGRFTGFTNTWFPHHIDLSAYKTSPIRLRFRLRANGNTAFDGWYIDDVSIAEKKASLTPFPFFEDFESGLDKWLVSGQDWDTTSIYFRRPEHAITDSPEGNYPPFSNATLTLACPIDLSLTNTPTLRFWHRYNVQTNADFCNVEISEDGGFAWTLLARFTGFSNTLFSQFDLSAYKTSPILIRFRLRADGGTQYDGWVIDDVEIFDLNPPAISATPSLLDFGDVFVGDSATDSITVINPISDTVHVNTISISGADSANFVTDPTPFDIAPGDSPNLNITFIPNDFKDFSTSLIIESDTGNVVVSLRGSGLSNISGDVDLNGVVQTSDADSILQFLIGATPLVHPQQPINANVSTDSTISPWDASVILQFVAGSVDSLPYDTALDDSGKITMADFDAETGDIIAVSLELLNGNDIFGFWGTVSYNPSDLEYQDIDWGDDLDGFSPVIYHDNASGTIRFAGADSLPLPSTQSTFFVSLRFQVKEGAQSSTVVALDSLRWNEGPFMENVAQSTFDIVTHVSSGDNGHIPEEYALHQNYPNPFNPGTLIRYDLPKATDVRIEVYNVLGQKVAELVNEHMPAGVHEVSFDASSLSSGVYLYRIHTAEFQQIKKMLLTK